MTIATISMPNRDWLARFPMLPEWVRRLFRLVWRKSALAPSPRGYVTACGEFHDEFGRVEFLPPCHGC
jgi:hypothetical protein